MASLSPKCGETLVLIAVTREKSAIGCPDSAIASSSAEYVSPLPMYVPESKRLDLGHGAQDSG
jgi:hypothetical protein